MNRTSILAAFGIALACITGLANVGQASIAAGEPTTSGKPDIAPTDAQAPTNQEKLGQVAFNKMLGRFSVLTSRQDKDGKSIETPGKIKQSLNDLGQMEETWSVLTPTGEKKTKSTIWSVTAEGIATCTRNDYESGLAYEYGTISKDGNHIELQQLANSKTSLHQIEFKTEEQIDEQGNTTIQEIEVHSTLAYQAPPSGSPTEQPPDPTKTRLIETTTVSRAELEAPDLAAMFGYMLPSEAHKRLVEMQGEWTTHVEVTPVGMPPFVGDGKVTVKFVLGKRSIEERHEFLLPMGPAELVVLIGHNNGTGQYQITRTMTLATGTDTLVGTHDASTGTITCVGEMWEPRVGDLVRQRATISKTVEGKRSVKFELDYGTGWTPFVVAEYTKVNPKPEKPATSDKPQSPTDPAPAPKATE